MAQKYIMTLQLRTAALGSKISQLFFTRGLPFNLVDKVRPGMHKC